MHYSRLTPLLRSILVWAICSFMLDGLSSFLWLQSKSNLFLGHLHTVVEFALLLNAYRLYFSKPGSKQWAWWLVVGVFALMAFANVLFLQDLWMYNTYIKIIESLVFISLALWYYFQLAREMKVARLEREPMFWLSTAIIIYFSGSFFIHTYSNYMLFYSLNLGVRIWFIHAIFFILFNMLVSMAYWTNPKK